MGQFICAFIGSRTHGERSFQAFRRLTRRYRSWDDVAEAPVNAIEATLAGVTYAQKKAPSLKQALRHIRARAGALDLESLDDLPVELSLFWLEQIHGVGRKIAAATLNFSTLRKPAFVVDTHVLRVLRRFGFVGAKADEVEAYEAVMAAAAGLDGNDLFELHWQLKRLGQNICTHFRIWCPSCALSDMGGASVAKSARARTR